MTNIIGQPKTIKLLNEDMIKEIIKNKGPITKPEIAKITNLSLATVNKIVERMYAEGIFTATGKIKSTGGRKAEAYILNGDVGVILGIYYYEDSFICFISNIVGEIKYKDVFKLRKDTEAFDTTDFLFKCIDSLIEQLSNKNIIAVGIGVPGVVKDGVISDIPNIKDFENKNLGHLINEKYGLEVFIENDVNITTMGIFYDKYNSTTSNMLYVYIGDGIGSGLIINKELYKGFSNFAGEIGYLTVGKSNKHSTRDAKYKGDFELSLSQIGRLLQEDPMDEVAINSFVETVSDALINTICLINPETIIVSCKYMSKECLDKIVQNVNHTIGIENAPKITTVEENEESNIRGIMSMCLREINSGYSIFKKKGD